MVVNLFLVISIYLYLFSYVVSHKCLMSTMFDGLVLGSYFRCSTVLNLKSNIFLVFIIFIFYLLIYLGFNLFICLFIYI